MECEDVPKQEPNLDLEELNHLQSLAMRSRVKEMLAALISKVQSEESAAIKVNERLKDVDAAPAMKPLSVATQHTTYFKPLMTYAWDQSDAFMKIYVDLKGVQKLPKESVTSTFTGKSFKLLVSGLDGQNYSCHVAYLWGKIVPDKCYHKVKSDTVLLMLKKEEERKTWPYVTETEGKTAKPKPKMDDKADPGDGLMDLMKKMYDDGDDEMKRTIAKAWSESRSKTGTAGGMDI